MCICTYSVRTRGPAWYNARYMHIIFGTAVPFASRKRLACSRCIHLSGVRELLHGEKAKEGLPFAVCRSGCEASRGEMEDDSRLRISRSHAFPELVERNDMCACILHAVFEAGVGSQVFFAERADRQICSAEGRSKPNQRDGRYWNQKSIWTTGLGPLDGEESTVKPRKECCGQ